jgi:hypothetical protein
VFVWQPRLKPFWSEGPLLGTFRTWPDGLSSEPKRCNCLTFSPDLAVVAEDISKEVLHADTSLNWLFVLPNRSPKELNRFLPEKTWTNGGKNKDRPTPLNEAMVVQHHGFGAHKLPREKVPSYLHLDNEDRAMLRFSMRIYTRRGLKSSKKGYPTAYVVLSLKKPIRRLRHARRS